ncbi:uncharacterized protein EV422DRAFT_206603 [Fimicolochytrium jonesii]|uniref:uncharacterized protein n=1 Tax=Fimicolochytrium jonesii TaxID=1396493 RepID=UPI0022FE8E1A|nr:uncharacterized protein EV422DRAFT_206603 [Fimicolochytrium jonesii]KAI8817811.1 hypothetical protein EV422DRAFT_206603 [Fimicolochytrium jonesii]
MRSLIALILRAGLSSDSVMSLTLEFLEDLKRTKLPGLEGPLNPSKPEGKAIRGLRFTWTKDDDTMDVMWSLAAFAIRILLAREDSIDNMSCAPTWSTTEPFSMESLLGAQWIEVLSKDFLDVAYGVVLTAGDVKLGPVIHFTFMLIVACVVSPLPVADIKRNMETKMHSMTLLSVGRRND